MPLWFTCRIIFLSFLLLEFLEREAFNHNQYFKFLLFGVSVMFYENILFMGFLRTKVFEIYQIFWYFKAEI